MPHQVDDERDPVTVVDDGPTPAKRQSPTQQILDAIAHLPDAVAERVEGTGSGHPSPTSGGAPEVTFVGDPLPEEAVAVDPNAPETAGGPPTATAPPPSNPDPAVHRAAFRHPAARKRRSEVIA